MYWPTLIKLTWTYACASLLHVIQDFTTQQQRICLSESVCQGNVILCSLFTNGTKTQLFFQCNILCLCHFFPHIMGYVKLTV